MRKLFIILCLSLSLGAFGQQSMFHMMNQLSGTEAQDFITAVEAGGDALSTTEENALIQYVADLKGYGLWVKTRALYPMIGSTASSQKWNLKDPRDLNAAYRLTFFNSPTHSAMGVDWNGTDEYATTYMTPSIMGRPLFLYLPIAVKNVRVAV